MGNRSDFMKSLVRGFAEGASRRLGFPLSNLQKLLKEALAQASSVTDSQISKALARVADVKEASAVCRDERIWIEATMSDGQRIKLNVTPKGARFAPRGAKEIVFHVEPEEMAMRPTVRDLIGAIGASVAHSLWAPFFGRLLNPSYDAIAEREGFEVRVDLRTVPAVRAAMAKGLGQLFDILELQNLHVVDGALRLHIRLPALFVP